jgi:hypothetical protein
MQHGLEFPYQTRPDKQSLQLWKEFILRSFCIPKRNDSNETLEFHLIPQLTTSTSDHNTYNDDCTELVRSISMQLTSLKDKFNVLPEKFKNIIGEITLPSNDGVALIKALREGDALLASDGSFLQEPYMGTHAYKLLPKSDPDLSIYGLAYSPNSNKMSSSPTEHYGAISVLIILVVLSIHFDDDCSTWPGTILLIDNKEVVDRGNSTPLFLNVRTYLMHDYDLWMLMVELQKFLGFTVMFEWIKSHQTSYGSNNMSKDDLKILGQKIQLNEEVDDLASKQYLSDQLPTERGAFYAGKVCYHQDGAHIQDIAKAISVIDSDRDILDYYVTKGWSMDTLKHVDWIRMESLLKQQSPIVRCNTIQMMHDWQNTGSQKQKFIDAGRKTDLKSSIHDDKRHHISMCPLGCNKRKDLFHFMQCTTDLMCETRKEALRLMA